MPLRMRDDTTFGNATVSDLEYMRAAKSLYKMVRGFTLPESEFEEIMNQNVEKRRFVSMVKEYCDSFNLDYGYFRRFFNSLLIKSEPEYESACLRLSSKFNLRKKEKFNI